MMEKRKRPYYTIADTVGVIFIFHFHSTNNSTVMFKMCFIQNTAALENIQQNQ